MKWRTGLAAFLLTLSGLVSAQSTHFEQRALWNTPVEPFRIVGNVYYVGTAHIGAYLVTDPAGHVLIDGGMEESAPRIADNVRKLGFRVEDIRYLLINHAHWDHAGGLSELKRRSNASLVASAADSGDLERGYNADRDDTARFAPVSVDRHIEDGDRVRIGGTELNAHLTPGHTPGCTTWTMRASEGERSYDVMFACSLTVAGRRLVGADRYPNAARDFEASFSRLRAIPVDVYLSFHAGHFDFDARRRLGANPLAFVDLAAARSRIDQAEAAFRAELAAQRSAAARGH